MSKKVDKILKAYDAGKSVAEIALFAEVTQGYVYLILRNQRPDRPRKKHVTRSDLPRVICELVAKEIKPSVVATALGVSRAYVYKVLRTAC